MRLLVALLAGAALFAAGCVGDQPTNGNTGSDGPDETVGLEGVASIPGLGNFALAEPISSGNVTLVPVVYKQAQDEPEQTDEYITLAEAKKNGWVEIIERPGEGAVNELQVRNTGPKPLLLLGGELLLGGKQDRIVAKDTIIPPNETVVVPVFCVEQGRWQGASLRFEYSNAVVPQSVRFAATYSDQARVWARVGEYNEDVGVIAGAPSTVQSGLSDPEVRKRVESGLDELLKSLEGKDNVVGVIFVLNGEIQTFELFGNAGLFEGSIQPLLRKSVRSQHKGSCRTTRIIKNYGP
ncbi:MAG: hypothetical protein IH851_14035, partial [Armatimonadetes bacterium]|nr:hypothetical protein [Armatimonadota bacterium]